MELYTEKRLLKPTTLFATFHVNDLCTILPHDTTIEVLERFLRENVSDGHIQGLTNHTIIQLVRFVMANQIFLFRKRVYRQTKGGTVNSHLTSLLANIYMFYWQADLVKLLVDKNEVFGRCFHEVFLTWDGSNSSFRALLNTTIKKKNPSMPITIAIGQKINYLNVQIYHMYGKLKTKISHDMDFEPRSLPFIDDHPLYMYSTLMRASLMRVLLCCSTLSDFQKEHRDIENIFSSNGFSSDYIKDKVDHFFEEFSALVLKSHCAKQNEYANIRRRLFEYDREQTEMKIKLRMEE